jgi:DNA-directed RNA polymerase specialized sigma subunit
MNNLPFVHLSDGYEKMLEESVVSKENNKELVQKIINGNTECAWELVIKNCRIVSEVLNRNFPHDVDDDAFSDGLWGFYIALTRLNGKYDISKTFYSYVAPYIFCYINRGMGKRKNINIKTHQKTTISHYDNRHHYEDDKEIANYEDLIEDSESLTNTLEERDKILFLTQIIKSFSETLNEKEKIIFNALIKHEGNITHAIQDLNCTRQNVCARKYSIVKKFLLYLQNNHLKEEFINSMEIKKENLQRIRDFRQYK